MVDFILQKFNSALNRTFIRGNKIYRLKTLNEDFSPDFLTVVLETISDLFDFETNGRTKYTPEDIACATLLMCLFNTSAETIQMIESLPSADRILSLLGEEKGLEMGEKINQKLKKHVRSIIFPKGVKIIVAGDITENLFYGDKNQAQVMGGKTKAGTNYFLKYLTFSLVVRGHWFPVGFCPLTQLHLPKLLEIIQKEITWLQKNGLCSRILLDRGFNDHKIYNLIQQEGTEFLMPLTSNKKLNEAFLDYQPHITKRDKKKGFVLKDYCPKSWNKEY